MVNLDEALYLTPTMMGALLPILSAKADPQVRYFSSSGIQPSLVLRGLRDRGRAGNDPSLTYLEWCASQGACTAEDCPHTLAQTGCVFGDEAAWKAANPALDRRITRDYVRAERRALAVRPAEFARERLGWWEDPPPDDAEADDALEHWPDCEDKSAAPQDPIVLAIAVAHSLRAASIVACGMGADGIPVVECVEYRKAGTDWIPGRG